MAINYIPEYLFNSQIIKSNYDNAIAETTAFREAIQDIYNQTFVDTATWGLDYWERELGMTVTPNDAHEIRRARIKAKIQSSSVFTKTEAQALANQFAYSGTSEFEERNALIQFVTRYEIDDLINFKELKNAFNEVKPAHIYHMVGLLISINLGISTNDDLKQFLKIVVPIDSGIIKQDYEALIKSQYKIYLVTKYNIEDEYSLVLDDSWALDGSEELDGVSEIGFDRYLKSSEHLTIQLKMNGEVIQTETV